MASKTLNQLTAEGATITVVTGNELLLLDQQAVSKTATVNQLKDYFDIPNIKQTLSLLQANISPPIRPDLLLRFEQNLDDEAWHTTWTNPANLGFEPVDVPSKNNGNYALVKGPNDPGVYCPNTNLNFKDDDFTLEIRFFITSFTQRAATLFASGPTSWGTNTNYIIVSGDANSELDKRRIHFGGPDLGLPMFRSNVLSDNQWYHLAITRRGNVFTMYIDGISQATATFSGTLTFDELGTKVGYNSWEIPTNAGYFDGKIDAVRVIKGVALRPDDFVL